MAQNLMGTQLGDWLVQFCVTDTGASESTIWKCVNTKTGSVRDYAEQDILKMFDAAKSAKTKRKAKVSSAADIVTSIKAGQFLTNMHFDTFTVLYQPLRGLECLLVEVTKDYTLIGKISLSDLEELASAVASNNLNRTISTHLTVTSRGTILYGIRNRCLVYNTTDLRFEIHAVKDCKKIDQVSTIPFSITTPLIKAGNCIADFAITALSKNGAFARCFHIPTGMNCCVPITLLALIDRFYLEMREDYSNQTIGEYRVKSPVNSEHSMWISTNIKTGETKTLTSRYLGGIRAKMIKCMNVSGAIFGNIKVICRLDTIDYNIREPINYLVLDTNTNRLHILSGLELFMIGSDTRKIRNLWWNKLSDDFFHNLGVIASNQYVMVIWVMKEAPSDLNEAIKVVNSVLSTAVRYPRFKTSLTDSAFSASTLNAAALLPLPPTNHGLYSNISFSEESNQTVTAQDEHPAGISAYDEKLQTARDNIRAIAANLEPVQLPDVSAQAGTEFKKLSKSIANKAKKSANAKKPAPTSKKTSPTNCSSANVRKNNSSIKEPVSQPSAPVVNPFKPPEPKPVVPEPVVTPQSFLSQLITVDDITTTNLSKQGYANVLTTPAAIAAIKHLGLVPQFTQVVQNICNIIGPAMKAQYRYMYGDILTFKQVTQQTKYSVRNMYNVITGTVAYIPPEFLLNCSSSFADLSDDRTNGIYAGYRVLGPVQEKSAHWYCTNLKTGKTEIRSGMTLPITDANAARTGVPGSMIGGLLVAACIPSILTHRRYHGARLVFDTVRRGFHVLPVSVIVSIENDESKFLRLWWRA